MISVETAILWSLLAFIAGMGLIILWTRYPFTLVLSTNEEFDPYLIETVKRLDEEKRKAGTGPRGATRVR